MSMEDRRDEVKNDLRWHALHLHASCGFEEAWKELQACHERIVAAAIQSALLNPSEASRLPLSRPCTAGGTQPAI